MTAGSGREFYRVPFSPAMEDPDAVAGNAALLLVDIQRKFSESTEGLRAGWLETKGTVNEAIRCFRSEGLPIVYLTYDGPMHGTSVLDSDCFADGLTPPVSGDPVISKGGMNAFCDSSLDDTLRELGCRSVIVAGMVSHCCVLATYFGAIDRGYSAFILKGGISATDPENTAAVERICRTISVEDLLGRKLI